MGTCVAITGHKCIFRIQLVVDSRRDGEPVFGRHYREAERRNVEGRTDGEGVDNGVALDSLPAEVDEKGRLVPIDRPAQVAPIRPRPIGDLIRGERVARIQRGVRETEVSLTME